MKFVTVHESVERSLGQQKEIACMLLVSGKHFVDYFSICGSVNTAIGVDNSSSKVLHTCNEKHEVIRSRG